MSELDINNKKIRNFCIIAHIDHWKSTLADRMLEITWTLEKRDVKTQTLDSMDIEQERWITIKLTPVRMTWKNNELNLIDTPGHADFQYEVSRSLASVEWAVLVVDATQWIEAQTLSNVYLAIENDLEIIPVLNKIDLPSADIERCSKELENLLWCDRSDIITVSAKTWENVELILDAIIDKISEPRFLDINSNIVERNDETAVHNATKALIFDSQYDTYKWVVIYCKVFSWNIPKRSKIEFLHSWKQVEALEVWHFAPSYIKDDELKEWQIWYIITWLRSIEDAKVWDTIYIWDNSEKNKKPIPWFKKIQPFVFAWVYPVDTTEYPQCKDAIEKLQLNDSALTVEWEVSPALWHWFRCGFLWLLHLDIVKERLWREFNMDVIMTSPQVTYRIYLQGDKAREWPRHKTKVIKDKWKTLTQVYISNPEDLPETWYFEKIEEPIAKCEIITPSEYVWAMMKLATDRRWIQVNQTYIDDTRILLSYEIPMLELVWDFYDELKSLSSWYASLNYEFLRFQEDDLVKLDILVAGDRLSALSSIVHRSRARNVWKVICKKLKDNIPRAMFAVAIQATLWSNIIARETLPAFRKDVTAGLYGWDISRKKKLLSKQKKGKKRMKQFWKVSIPSDTFVNILKK